LKPDELMELLKFAWRKGEIYGLYGLHHNFKDIKESDTYGLDSTWYMTRKQLNEKLLSKGLTIYILRENYIDYLIKKYDCTEEDCHKAWIKAQKHFPNYNPESGTQRLTLEVAMRDMIDGVFIPKLAEVENIE